MKSIFAILIFFVSFAFGANLSTYQTNVLKLKDGSTANSVSLQSPSLSSAWTFTFPTTDGNSGECLQTDGSGVTSWGACGSGSSPLTTKGDIYVYSTINDRLPVGTNGQVLSSNSATATGLQWVTPTSSTPGGVSTQVQYNSAGSFAGANLYWNSAGNNFLISDGVTTFPGASFHLSKATGSLVSLFENTQNSGETTIRYRAKDSGGVTRGADSTLVPGTTSATTFVKRLVENVLSQTNYGDGLVSLGSGSNVKQTLPFGTSTVEITSSSSSAALNMLGANASEGPEINLTAANGTASSPTVTAANKILGDIRFSGYTGAQPAAGAIIRAQQTGAITAGNAPSKFLFYQVNDAGTINNTFEMNRNGVLHGYQSHNPTGASSFTTAAPSFYSGTWTPTFTNVVNCGAFTAYTSQYMRVGNVVTASMRYDVAVTANNVCVANFTLPVTNNNFAAAAELAGGGAADDGAGFRTTLLSGQTGDIKGRTQFVPAQTTTASVFVNFTYLIK